MSKISNTVRVLCVGDVVGSTGRAMFQKHIPHLKEKHAIDVVMVNGENSANDGRGITARVIEELKKSGADIITSGNHVWDKKEVYSYLDQNVDVLRPANYPQGVPGVGSTIITTPHGHSVGFVNILGRVFMRENLACPFRTADSLLTYLKSRTSTIIVDFHAEATSEKLAFAYYLEGKVSAVVGTHTHIQTADARVLPGGTAYITDLGMVGSLNSMIGMTKESVMRQFLTQMPTRFAVDTSVPLVLSGVLITIDTANGRALDIEPIRIYDEELVIQKD